MLLVVCLMSVLARSPARLPMPMAASNWVFSGLSIGGGAGGAPVALHGWHPLAARFQRPCPSDSGVERRNPLGTVAICGLQRHFREGGRAHMLWEALGPHLSCEREEIVAICD